MTDNQDTTGGGIDEEDRDEANYESNLLVLAYIKREYDVPGCAYDYGWYYDDTETASSVVVWCETRAGEISYRMHREMIPAWLPEKKSDCDDYSVTENNMRVEELVYDG